MKLSEFFLGSKKSDCNNEVFTVMHVPMWTILFLWRHVLTCFASMEEECMYIVHKLRKVTTYLYVSLQIFTLQIMLVYDVKLD